MASSSEVSGRRRAPRGTEDSASKKKQKDKANQESKEAKRTASDEAKKGMVPSEPALCLISRKLRLFW